MVSLPGPVSLHLWIFWTSFWSYLVMQIQAFSLVWLSGWVCCCFVGWCLPLRYCSAKFAWKLPTWRLPDRGRVRELVTDSVDVARVIGCVGVGGDLFPPSVSLRIGFWEALKEFDSTEKHHHTLLELGTVGVLISRSKDWKRLRVSGVHWCSVCDSRVLHECHHGGVGSSLGYRVGVG